MGSFSLNIYYFRSGCVRLYWVLCSPSRIRAPCNLQIWIKLLSPLFFFFTRGMGICSSTDTYLLLPIYIFWLQKKTWHVSFHMSIEKENYICQKKIIILVKLWIKSINSLNFGACRFYNKIMTLIFISGFIKYVQVLHLAL